MGSHTVSAPLHRLALVIAASLSLVLTTHCGDDDASDDTVSVDTMAGAETMDDSATDPTDVADTTSPDGTLDEVAGDTTEEVVATAPTVTTASGPVQGFTGEGYRAFLGIPFAKPPVGELRFAPPEAPEPWTEPLVADTFGPACPQMDYLLADTLPETSEDCLTLNVWTPDPVPEDAPVMLWIHGGGFVWGSAAEPMYDGQDLAREGVIVVTFDYRLGALGFLSHQALAAEDASHPASGNYGLMDQQHAMRWVQENIAAFGGDPGNVTIFGESAGAVGVCTHLAVTKGEGLYHKAIMQSGLCSGNPTLEEAEAQGALLAEAVGCADAADVPACLREVPADDMVTALPLPPGLFFGTGYDWGPTIDGLVVQSNTLMSVLAGQIEQVPVIIGANEDEGDLFLAMVEGGFSEDDYHTIMDLLMPGKADDIVAQYPPEDYESVDYAMADAMGDGMFVCTARFGSKMVSMSLPAVYLYYYTHDVDTGSFGITSSFHTADIKMVFGVPFLGLPLTDEEVGLSALMQGYWTRFAANGDPNGGDAPTWPAQTATSPDYMILDVEPTAAKDLEPEVCSFWEGVYLSM